MTPLNSTGVVPNMPAVSAVNEVYVRGLPYIDATTTASNAHSAAAPEDDAGPLESRISSAETRLATAATADGSDSQQQQDHDQVDVTASSPRGVPTAAAAVADSQAWVISFAPKKPIPTRKMTKKEKETIEQLRLRSQTIGAGAPTATMTALAAGGGLGADSEGNTVVTLGVGTSAALPSSPLQVVHLETPAVDLGALIPTNLPTTRADLEERLVLRLPRLLCVSKQYPRGCGIASLASVYNYLYSWLGESAVGANRAPHSQEELMSILGFEPPFGDIAWGPFTGNATLIRWFHALNRHFGVRGRAYILYKAHGSGNTAHLYANNTEALAAVKAALRDPHCALIYHCYNHYMVPIGYQDIPLAQTDFLKPDVPESNCDTTIFIGEVSRGRHEAMYARKWSQIVKDIECKSPFFFNIRHPEQGVQRRGPKKSCKEGVSEGAGAAAPHAITGATTAAAAAAATEATKEVEASQPPQPEPEGQGQKDRSSSGAYSAAATILVASTNAPPGSAATVPCDIDDNDVDVDVLENAARSTNSDTVEMMPFAAAATPSLPSAASPAPLQQPLSHSSPTPGVSTRVVLKPDFAEPSGDAAGSLFVTAELQPQVVAEEELVAAECGATCEESAGASPATRSASLSLSDARGAPLADNAMASVNEAIGSVPVPSSPPASSSPRQKPTQLGNACAGAGKTAEPPHSSQPARSPAKSKKGQGNLHCIICFRNDEVEPHLERYEDAPVPLAGAAEEPLWRSLSLSSGDNSSSSNADDA
ncbi:conserved hypothetical protein [Leishmania major strain Friedlin]|uniref:Uncharacterized protein n=1 Tax=Leishmania major TaxID=5664 RepID=Q4QJ24_LEIMA|nr:conserved hypothetical protein [Leishmania major strain Friedlin]CAG9568849.1 hypothetical_protein_-_conserved [Leishmania major strain Friedlin]CAJ02099.1 conserved hypothetical protein [Leishmania major strain Friedlin]|eukprot:XP_001680824.1 conserved hypothetical protein [Leishmania major strain Friedlin]